jgi:CxxC motif-containing protein (DUF1111 family)
MVVDCRACRAAIVHKIEIAGNKKNRPNKYFDTRIREKETSIHSRTHARVGTFSALEKHIGKPIDRGGTDMKRQYATTCVYRRAAVALAMVLAPTLTYAQIDPGPRGGAAGAGAKIAGLTVKEGKFFDAGLDEFGEVQSVTGSVLGTEEGLGPRFNMNSCSSCHAHPAVGGTSPANNPQVVANPVSVSTPSQINDLVALNIISATGPVREVRFNNDGGGVHQLFTIMGLPGTPAACTLSQPDFAGNASALTFRIPTPVFGLGLIEAIEDATILANVGVSKPFGILGTANRNGNDGTVTRFGWKAQNKSLVIFAGEAYNVEQGITNELFPDERGDNGVPDSVDCRRVVPAPQDLVHYELSQPQKLIDNVNSFANFMRFLAPPTPATSYTGVTQAQIVAGEAAFNKAGCAACHIKSMTTGNHATAALRNKVANLFSDLLVHDIATGDQISQGNADGTQFRTAPLWGLGQRLFFMHDGRTSDLVTAINGHGGEALPVTLNFLGTGSVPLDATERQNLIYFLRSL